jgi:hypothetical protein
MSQTFSILSVGAPLVEVIGDGPALIRPGGLVVPDGKLTTAPVRLLDDFIRRFRVVGPPTVRATVTVTDSPFGVFVGVRRCVPLVSAWARLVAPERWPRLRTVVKRVSPSAVALWHLFADEEPAPCRWRDIGDDNTNRVSVRGGDLVVVTFVVP